MIRFVAAGEKYEFDDGKYSNLELLEVKAKTTEHWGINDFLQAFTQNDVEALTVMVWLARRRSGETELRITEVEFDVVEFMESFEADGEETDAEGDPTGSDPEATEDETPSI